MSIRVVPWAVLAGAVLLSACIEREQPLAPEAGPDIPGLAPLYSVQNGPPDRYIVIFREDRVGRRAGGQAASARDAADEALRVHGGVLHFVYQELFSGFAATLSPAAVDALRRNPNVEQILADRYVEAEGPGEQAGPVLGLDRIDQRDLPYDTWYRYPASGAGVNVYVLDSGIRTSHADFGGRASVGRDFIGDGQNGQDCRGHGTHVAGTIGGTTYGVAKSARLISVRVLPCSGPGSSSETWAGMDWVADFGVRPAVVNMSLGGAADGYENLLVKRLHDLGYVVVVSAGNDTADACLKSPASAPHALTVAATRYFLYTGTIPFEHRDLRPIYSNYGSCVDLFAPGHDVTSTWHTSSTATNTISGTSMAAPHVAGAAAIYLELFPNASPDVVAAAILNNTTPGKVYDAMGSPNRLLHVGFFGAVVAAAQSSRVSVGGAHSCVLRTTIVECRGANGFGQAPASRAALTGTFTQLSAGGNHTCARRSDGVVECWGLNTSGQAPATRSAPLGQTFRHVSAGSQHSCAVRSSGDVECWGANPDGRAPEVALSGVAVQVAAGGAHTCALQSDGAISCWGANGSGQAPATRRASLLWYTQVTAGWLHTCALRFGIVECWGDNGYGQAPATRTAAASHFTEVAAGDWHTCARRNDGVVECWGAGATASGDVHWGQAPPVKSAGGSATYLHAGAGWQTSCALRSDGGMDCFGRNTSGQAKSDQRITFAHAAPGAALVTGVYPVTATSSSGLTVTISTANPAVCSLSGGVVRFHTVGTCEVRADQAGNASYLPAGRATQSFSIGAAVSAPPPLVATAGGAHSCRLSDGVARCWGWNGFTQAQAQRPAMTGTFTQLAASSNFNCARRSDGVVECWGNNDKGQAPATKAATTLSFSQVGVGFDWACGLRTDGVAECWGNTADGRAPATRAASTAANGGRFVQVGGGSLHTCALRADGVIECWGLDLIGEAPATRAATSGHFVQVSVGGQSTCGLRNTGIMECWGALTGTFTAGGGSTFTQVGVGFGPVCARRADGVIQCWGTNGNGQAPPTRTVAGGFLQASAGTIHSCGLTTSGLTVCWGDNGAGQAKSEQRVSFTSTAPASLEIGGTYAMAATSTAGLAVSFEPLTTLTCTEAAGVATMLALGTCNLATVQNGNADWLPAPRVTQSLEVTPLAAPASVTATPASATRVDVAWVDVSQTETGYTVQRRQATGPGTWSGYTTLGTLAANATAHADVTAAPQTTYQYRVRACRSGECSAWSSAPDVTTPDGVMLPPAAPGSFSTVVTSATAVRLTWEDLSDNESRFSIGRREQVDAVWSAWTEIATPAANTSAFNNTGLVTGRPYQYRIRSCNAGGCSVFVTSPSITPIGAPAAPANLAAAVVNAARIGLTWTDGSTDETNFALQRRISTGGVWGAWADIAAPAANAVSHVDIGLTSDLTYQYRLRACNAGGCSAFVVAPAILLPSVPATPGNPMSVATSASQIVTTWTDLSGNETGFAVQRRARTGSTWGEWSDAGIVGANVTTHTSTGLTPGATYQLRVRACNAAGCSPLATAAAVATATPPAAPVDVNATIVSAARIRVSWTDASTDEQEFVVSRRTRVGDVWGAWEEVGRTGANTVEYLNLRLEANLTYQYRVRACNPGGCSTWTSSRTVTIPLVPDAPTGFSATPTSPTQVNLSWVDASTTEAGFEVWMRTRIEGVWGDWAQVATTGANATGHAVAGLGAGGTYQFRIRACNASGCSAYVNASTVTTPAS